MQQVLPRLIALGTLALWHSGTLALLGYAASAAAQTPAPANKVRMGVIFPLTGGSSDMGNSARVGAQVAVDEVNQVGGYMGRPLELVIRDDKADPETGLKAAEDLVLKEKVTATIGFCNTGVAMKAMETFQKNNHVLIVTCATGTTITTKYPAAESYVFRTSARDALQTQFLVDDIIKRKHRKIALLVDTSGYGNEVPGVRRCGGGWPHGADGTAQRLHGTQPVLPQRLFEALQGTADRLHDVGRADL